MTTTPGEVRAEVKRLLPPSMRDREIFERVAGKREGQAAVAKEYGLTQARVSQIIDLVRVWLAEANDDEAGDLPPQKQLRLGSRVVRMRLECLLTDTMEGWRASQGKLTTTKERMTISGDVVENVTKESFGDVKYLTAYRSVALALARLDGVPIAPKFERAVPETREEPRITRMTRMEEEEVAVVEQSAGVDEEPRMTPMEEEPVESDESATAESAETDLYVETAVASSESVSATEEVVATTEADASCAVTSDLKVDYVPGESARKRAYKKAFRERQKRRERAGRRDEFVQSKPRQNASHELLAAAP